MKMLERVARALARSDGAKMTGPSRHKASDTFGWDAGHQYMQKYVEANWQKFTGDAYAALEAVRDADDAMLEAMHVAMFQDTFDSKILPMLGAGFEAAIDAALAE